MKKSSECLINKKCLPCEGGIPSLTKKQSEVLFKELNAGWKIVDDHHLEKTYKFPDFRHALNFTNLVGQVAETEGHHPDIFLSWGMVKIQLWTHKVSGLTENDFILAAKIDEEFPKSCQKACF